MSTSSSSVKLETSCPACGKPITVWRVMAAPTPWHLSCGACKARLRAVGLTVPALVLTVALGLPLAWFAQRMIAAGETRQAIAIVVAAIALFELLASLVVVTRARLEAKR